MGKENACVIQPQHELILPCSCSQIDQWKGKNVSRSVISTQRLKISVIVLSGMFL